MAINNILIDAKFFVLGVTCPSYLFFRVMNIDWRIVTFSFLIYMCVFPYGLNLLLRIYKRSLKTRM